MSHQTCSTCFFWNTADDSVPGNGQCKRRAPWLPNEGQAGNAARWPVTNEHDGCGDHRTPDQYADELHERAGEVTLGLSHAIQEMRSRIAELEHALQVAERALHWED